MRDGTSALIRELPAPAEEFHREKSVPDLRHVTTLGVKIAFSPAKQIPDPRSGAGTFRFTGQTVRQALATLRSCRRSFGHPDPLHMSQQFIGELAAKLYKNKGKNHCLASI